MGFSLRVIDFNVNVWRAVASTYSHVLQRTGPAQSAHYSPFAAVISSIFAVIPKPRDLKLFYNCRTTSEMSAAVYLLGHIDSTSIPHGHITLEMAQDFRSALEYLFVNAGDASRYYHSNAWSVNVKSKSDVEFETYAMFSSGHSVMVDSEIGCCYPVQWRSVGSMWDAFGILANEFTCEFSDPIDLLITAKLLSVGTFVHFGWAIAEEGFVLIQQVEGLLSEHDACRPGCCDRGERITPRVFSKFWRMYYAAMNPECTDSKRMIHSVLFQVLRADRTKAGVSSCPCSIFHFSISRMCKIC